MRPTTIVTPTPTGTATHAPAPRPPSLRRADAWSPSRRAGSRHVRPGAAPDRVRRPGLDRRLVRALVASLPVVLAVGALTFVFADLRPRTYEATARVVVAAAPTPDDADQVVDSVTAAANRRFLATYADIVASAVVQRAAITAALVATGDADDYTIATAVSPGSTAVDVRVAGPDPDRAAAVARNVLEEAGTTFEDFYPVFAVRVVDQPVAAREPAGRPAGRAGLTAAALTFVLWMVGVTALHAWAAHVRDAASTGATPPSDRLVTRREGA